MLLYFRRNNFARKWGYGILRAVALVILRFWFGFKVSGSENLPKNKKVILAANHASVLDGIALACAYPDRVYYLVLDSLYNTKLIGWFFKRLGFIPVKRGGVNKESLRVAIELINSGYSLGIFPEGKISQDGKLAEGKEGVAVIAKLTGALIIPCAIKGTYEAWPLKNKYPRKSPVEVRFEKPIEVKEFATHEALLKEVMESIA
jgi:1-acyl-sn-glycerol-3-phosphate acyltransferase